MTTMSNTDAVALALIPGMAETLGSIGHQRSQPSWENMANKVRRSRNYVYLGIALTAITGIIHATFDRRVPRTPLCIIGYGLGGIITAIASKYLYTATTAIQAETNAGHRP